MRRWDRAAGYGSRCAPAVMVAALAAGCGGGVTPTHWTPEQTWTSAHFVYHAKPDDSSVDATVVDALEAHAAVTAARWLGLPSDGWGPIDYFKYHDENELVGAGSPCNDRPCTTLFESGRIEIHTPLAIDEHELTHSYVLGSTCAPPLFREGLAVSASCDPANEPLYETSAERPPWLDLSWRDLTDFAGPAPKTYQPAGALVTWLVDQWGVSSFMAFYRSLRCDMSNDQIAAAFNAHYGQSLDDAWSAMTAAPRRRLCAFTWGCSESLASGAVPLTNALAGYRTAVPIPDAGAMVRATYAPAVNPPVLRGCTADAALPGFDGHWPLEPDAWFPVAVLTASAGNSVALGDVRGAPDNPLVALATTVLPLAAASVVADGACASATPLVFDEQRGTVLFWPHPGGAAVFQVQSSIVPAQAVAQIRYDYSGPDTASVQTCSACSGGQLQDCADAMLAPRMNAPWLRVDWSPVVPSLLALSFQWD